MLKLQSARASLVGSLVGLAMIVPVANGASITHSRFDAVVAQVVWGSGDIETGVGDWGGIAVFRQPDLSMITMFEEHTTATICDAGTADSADDYPGLATMARHGDGPVTTLAVAANLKSAHASGWITITSFTSNSCTGESVVSGVDEDIPVTIDLSASSTNETWVDLFREIAPGEYSVFGVLRSRGYAASGTVTLDGDPVAFGAGAISRNSGQQIWRE